MAIARDANSLAENQAGTAVTLSHTCASAAVLAVALRVSTLDTPSSVTYAGATMTSIDTQDSPTSSFRQLTYFIGSPSSGTNDIVVNFPTSKTVSICALSYTGADSTVDNNIDATGGSNTTFTATQTVNTSDSWGLMFASNATGGNSSSSTNWTKINGFSNVAGGDTNGQQPTGPLTMTGTWSASGFWVASMIILKPSGGATVTDALSFGHFA